jgi:N-terminal domain on NACHT_NTPase and P-loop NTPases
MAELLAAGAALGVASSLITFGDVAWRVLKRIKEYSDKTGDVPVVIRHISAQLPVIIEKIEELKEATKNGSLHIQPQSALAGAVISCNEQVQRLDALTDKMLPSATDTRKDWARKAIRSVRYEKEIANIWATMEAYKTTFIFHFTQMSAAVSNIDTSRSTIPIFAVPFERDTKFVGRINVLDKIEQDFKAQSRVAIAGIGGVG